MQPPQNPYSGMPGPNDPIPPQSPYGSTPTPPGFNPRAGTVSLDTIGEAWRILQPNIGPWIGAALIYGLIVGAVQFIQTMATPKDTSGVPHYGPIPLIFSLVGFVVGQFLIAGLIKMAISNVRTGRAEIGEMFNVTDVIGNILIAAILSALAIGIGFILCIIPGVFIACCLTMTTPLIVDQKMSAMDAMSRSWNTLKPQFGAIFIFGLVCGLINIAGAIACLVGLFITWPLTQIALALVYRDLFLGGNMGTAPPTYPTAPIASPNG